MSCTPIWTILSRLVKPILMPTCFSPRAKRRPMLSFWTAYASSSEMRSESCAISFASFAALSTRSANPLISAMSGLRYRLCERHAYRTHAVDARVQDVARRDLDHRSECAGHDHVAGFERASDIHHRSRQPQRGVQRMSQASSAGTHRYGLAAALHHHAAQAQIQPIELAGLRAEREQSGGCVVCDRVEQLDVPFLDATTDDFHCRQHISHRR